MIYNPLGTPQKSKIDSKPSLTYTLNKVHFFLRDFIFKKTLFEKLQYLKQEQSTLKVNAACLRGPTQFFGNFFICRPIRTKFAQYL